MASRSDLDSAQSDVSEKRMEIIRMDTSSPVFRVDRYGQLQRSMKSRHIQFLAIGGIIGTSLFIGAGEALTKGGPLSLLLAYAMMAPVYFTTTRCICSMSTYLPLSGGLVLYAKRFVSDEFAFAVGINTWLGGLFKLCAEIVATAQIIQYWTTGVHSAIWITSVLFLVTLLNLLQVATFGRVEFTATAIKIVGVLALLIASIVITSGGNPNHESVGFRFWRIPGPMASFQQPGSQGRFLGLLACYISAAFAYNGSEIIAYAAAETFVPSSSIPLACKKVFIRVTVAYLLGVLAVGVLIAYNDSDLVSAIVHQLPGAEESPFVIAMRELGVTIFPTVLNAALLVSAFSYCNAWLYTSSRSLYALALAGKAPKLCARTREGVPYIAVLITACLSLLSFFSAIPATKEVYSWLVPIGALSGMFSWLAVQFTYMRFRQAAIIQEVALQVQVPGSLIMTWIAFGITLFIIIVHGYDAWFTFDWSEIVKAYLGLFLFIALLVPWSRRFGIIPLVEIDFHTGRKEVIDHESEHKVPVPTTFIQKVIAFLA